MDGEKDGRSVGCIKLQKKDEGADQNINSDGYRENRREIGTEKRESVKER